MDDSLDRIVSLDEVDDFRVAPGEPDVRGWNVFSGDGRRIGEVDDLLIDTTAMKVRYLDVELDGGVVEGAGDRHILVPIGHARLDEERDEVHVDALRSTDLDAIPGYREGAITPEFETDLHRYFDGEGASANPGPAAEGEGES